MIPTIRTKQVSDNQIQIFVQVDCGTVLGEPHVAESLVFSGPREEGVKIAMGLHVLWAKMSGEPYKPEPIDRG